MTVHEPPKRRGKPSGTAASSSSWVPKPLTNSERAELVVYAERAKQRPRPPRFALRRRAATSDDPDAVSQAAGMDPDLFQVRLAQTFGTVDELAVGLLLSQAAYVVEGKETAQLCNSAAALIAGIAPRNEIEGMLAVQCLQRTTSR